MEGHSPAAGVGQEHSAGLQVVLEPGPLLVGPVELVVPRHVEQGIAHGLGVLGPHAHLLELDGQGRVVPDVLEQVVNGRRIGVPVAVVHELGEDEIVAAGRVGLVVDLGAAQEPAELVAAQQVSHVVGADLAGLVDHNPQAARVVVAVPAAGQVDRRVDDGRAAADVMPSRQGASSYFDPSAF